MACTNLTVVANPTATVVAGTVGFEQGTTYLNTDCQVVATGLVGQPIVVGCQITVTNWRASFTVKMDYLYNSVAKTYSFNMQQDPGTVKWDFAFSTEVYAVGSYTNLTVTLSNVVSV